MSTDVDFLRIVSDADLQRFMLVACPDGVIVTDTDDRVVLYTGAAEEIFRFAPVEVLHRRLSTVFDSCVEVQRLTHELHRCGMVAGLELTAVRKDGSRFPAVVRAAAMRDRYGAQLGTVLYVRERATCSGGEAEPRERDEWLGDLGDTLDQVAKHDGMTGLLRRSSAVSAAEQALRECEQGGRPFSVALFDIDRFGAVNERYGHPAGDRVLGALAAVLHDTARANDIVGRFSGGRLVAFLPGAGPEAVHKFAERVRAAGEEAWIIESGEEVRATMSAGVAAIPACAPGLDEALSLAEQRLNEAKRLGRNRVVAGDPGDGRNTG